MQCASIAARQDIIIKIRTLEESACFLTDLANGSPEQAEWLRNIADRLATESEILAARLLSPHSSLLPDST